MSIGKPFFPIIHSHLGCQGILFVFAVIMAAINFISAISVSRYKGLLARRDESHLVARLGGIDIGLNSNAS
jgi:hypothetical protein